MDHKKTKSPTRLGQRQAVKYLRILYPAWAIVGMLSIIYIPSKLIVAGDAATTAHNILANQFLFRLGITGVLLTQLFYIAVALLLYKLFKKVNKDAILLLLVLALVSVPIAMFNAINPLAAVMLLSDSQHLSAFSAGQVQVLATFFLNLDQLGEMIATIFWGLWLIPLGYLVKQSGYFPKIIGWFLYLAALGYLLDAFTHFLAPEALATTAPVVAVLTMGELLYMLWFIFAGVKLPSAAANKK